jgi:hypothetical protein
MKELIAYQQRWEAERGIVNGNYNLDRTQLEMDEAKEEADPFKKLVEMVDVVIIVAGGMARLCDELGLPYDEVDNLIKMKLEINNIKYALEFFDGRDPNEAMAIAKDLWKQRQIDSG